MNPIFKLTPEEKKEIEQKMSEINNIDTLNLSKEAVDFILSYHEELAIKLIMSRDQE
jgi:hypothetical protein